MLILVLTCSIVTSSAYPAPPLKKIPAAEPVVEQKAKDHGRNVAQAIREDMKEGRLVNLSRQTDRALDMVVARGVAELRKKGLEDEANLWEGQWAFHYYGYLTRMTASRDIGDHKPLVTWLAVFYDRLEFILGVEACKMLHLSDIKTFNFCIPIVFHPCSFPMDLITDPRKTEYRRHFAAGAVYYGLIPVVTYWLIDVPCLIGTSCIASFLCGGAATAGEYVMGKFLAPKLSDRLFDRVCGSEDL